MDKQEIFNKLYALLKKYDKGPVEGRTTTIGSKATGSKPAYHLYGKKEVAIGKRKPQQTYVAGIIEQKNFVGFYSMGVYSHPKLIKPEHPKLKKFLKGKSCFNVTEVDAEILRDMERLIKENIAVYRQEGWI